MPLASFQVTTAGPGRLDVSAAVDKWPAAGTVEEGLITLFARHTSASLIIQENADPDMPADLQSFFDRIAPWDGSLYRHRTEGRDDMAA